jgi:hypothetical protein
MGALIGFCGASHHLGHMTAICHNRTRRAPAPEQIQLQAESGILTGSAGTNVATETCGHDRFLKFRITVCEYWI